jgi:hypothetical protein
MVYCCRRYRSSSAARSRISRTAAMPLGAGDDSSRDRSTSSVTNSPRRVLAGWGPQSRRNASQVTSSTATRATRAPAYPPREVDTRAPPGARMLRDAGVAAASVRAPPSVRRRLRLGRLLRAITCSASVYSTEGAIACPRAALTLRCAPLPRPSGKEVSLCECLKPSSGGSPQGAGVLVVLPRSVSLFLGPRLVLAAGLARPHARARSDGAAKAETTSRFIGQPTTSFFGEPMWRPRAIRWSGPTRPVP